MGRIHIEAVVRELHYRRIQSKTNQEAFYWKRLIDRLETGMMDYEEQIQLAKMLGDRNPDFPGDMVGRPDDDFDE